MRREAITLVLATMTGTVLLGACEKEPPQPKTANSSPPPATPAAVPSPPPPVAPSPTENKDGTPPVQGQVDTKDPPQKKDFQQSR
jgi:hypothetical protein